MPTTLVHTPEEGGCPQGRWAWPVLTNQESPAPPRPQVSKQGSRQVAGQLGHAAGRTQSRGSHGASVCLSVCLSVCGALSSPPGLRGLPPEHRSRSLSWRKGVPWTFCVRDGKRQQKLRRSWRSAPQT